MADILLIVGMSLVSGAFLYAIYIAGESTKAAQEAFQKELRAGVTRLSDRLEMLVQANNGLHQKADELAKFTEQKFELLRQLHLGSADGHKDILRELAKTCGAEMKEKEVLPGLIIREIKEVCGQEAKSDGSGE